MTTTHTYTYVGGRAAVDIKLPSGRIFTVQRGESLDVTHSDDVSALDRHPEWERDEPTPPTTSTEEIPE